MSPGLKIFILSGEASGDIHAARLARYLRQFDPNIVLEGWGGDEMSQAGVILHKHYRDLAFMGFIEVAKNIKTILSNFTSAKEQITKFNPDAILLVDYPGFNLRIAKWSKSLGFKNIYYISPQVWAWKANRALQIKRNIDLMLCILPFEPAFYQKYDYEAFYVGHPLIERIEDFRKSNISLRREDNLIALLPGSRKQEILALLPEYLQVAKPLVQFKFEIAVAPHLHIQFYESVCQHALGTSLSQYPHIQFNRAGTYNLLSRAKAALVTSGTATLETALFGVPQIVCYKAGNLSYQIAKRLIKVPYISLVNLILNQPLVTELIQGQCKPPIITEKLLDIWDEGEYSRILEGYGHLNSILCQQGSPSEKAASKIIEFLK